MNGLLFNLRKLWIDFGRDIATKKHPQISQITQMNLFQRWKHTTIANQLMVLGTAIVAVGTLCLALASLFQYLAAIEQGKTAANQLALMQTQLNTMQDQANRPRK